MSCFSVSLTPTRSTHLPVLSPFLRCGDITVLSHSALCRISPFLNDSLSPAFIPDEILTSSCYSWLTSLAAAPPVERFLRAVTRTRAPTCLHLAACCVCCLPFSCELCHKSFLAKTSNYLEKTGRKRTMTPTLSCLSSHL